MIERKKRTKALQARELLHRGGQGLAMMRFLQDSEYDLYFAMHHGIFGKAPLTAKGLGNTIPPTRTPRLGIPDI